MSDGVFHKAYRGFAQAPGPIGDLYVGATPMRGLSIGGFFRDMAIPAYGDNLWMAGPYVDFYPIPANGLHLLANGGVADDIHFSLETKSTFGFSLGAGAGYDLWMRPGWGCGVLAGVTYASFGRAMAILPAALLTMVYQ